MPNTTDKLNAWPAFTFIPFKLPISVIILSIFYELKSVFCNFIFINSALLKLTLDKVIF